MAALDPGYDSKFEVGERMVIKKKFVCLCRYHEIVIIFMSQNTNDCARKWLF